MPSYEYACTAGHLTTDLRPYEQRDEPLTCECGQQATRIFSAPHVRPSGEYSYAPNIGDPDAHERKNAKIRGEIPNDWEGSRG